MVEAQLMRFRGNTVYMGKWAGRHFCGFSKSFWLCFQTTVPNEWARPLLIASLATPEGNGFLLSLLHQQFFPVLHGQEENSMSLEKSSRGLCLDGVHHPGGLPREAVQQCRHVTHECTNDRD